MSSDFGARDSCERLTVTRSFSKLIEQGVLEIGDGYRAKNDELGGDGLIFYALGMFEIPILTSMAWIILKQLIIRSSEASYLFWAMLWSQQKVIAPGALRL
ncbi:hypothetical protein P4209_11820 [Pseudomonas aeruginosa]|nr:hypothetical protein [Pseudomonas aeruginosa]MDF5927121.1 hypothetical protein [Pseudomonas aeruginosa]